MVSEYELFAMAGASLLWLCSLVMLIFRRRRAALVLLILAIIATIAVLALLRAGTGHRA